MSEKMFIAIVGNPSSGFSYYGPFETAEAAIEYGSDDGRLECWASVLISPSAAHTLRGRGCDPDFRRNES